MSEVLGPRDPMPAAGHGTPLPPHPGVPPIQMPRPNEVQRADVVVPVPAGTHVQDVTGSAIATEGGLALYNSTIGTLIMQHVVQVQIIPRERPLRYHLQPTVTFRDRVQERNESRPSSPGIVVELVGPRGIGKTTLLEELARGFDVETATASRSLNDGVALLAVADLTHYGDLLYYIWMTFYSSNIEYRPAEPSMRVQLASIQALVLLDDAQLNETQLSALRQLMPRSVIVVSGTERRLFGSGASVLMEGLPLADTVDLVAEVYPKHVGTPPRAAAVDQVKQLWQRYEGQPFSVLKGFDEWLRQGPPDARDELRSRIRHLVAALPEPVSREALVPLVRVLLASSSSDGEVESLVDEMVDRRELRAASPAYSAVGDVLLEADELAELRRKAADVLSDPALPLTSIKSVSTLVGLAQDDEGLSFDTRMALARRACAILFRAGHWEAWHGLLGYIYEAARAQNALRLQAWALHERGVSEYGLGEAELARRSLEAAHDLRADLSTGHPGDSELDAELRLTENVLHRVLMSASAGDDNGDGGDGSDSGSGPPVVGPPMPLSGPGGGEVAADSSRQRELIGV